MRCKLRAARVRLNQVLIFGLVVALFSVVLPSVTASPAAAALTEQQKADRVAPLIRALEDYAADHGTYAVDGAGWRGGGQGWFGYTDGNVYPESVAQILVDGGYLASGEGWETSSTQFMVYLCGSRAAVFTRSTVAVTSGDVSAWSGCNQNPVTRYNRKYYEVTATLADVEEAKQVDVAVGALEAYAMDHGTYAVAGGGSRGRGVGWFSFSNNRADSYPKSVGQVLVEQGYLPAGEGWETSSTKYMVYLCNGRAAVYSASQVMVSADDAAAWTGCYQGPTSRPHYRVTASPADLTTANLVGQIVDALEDYAADHGTYAVSDSGWRGGGQGWFGFSNGISTSYPASVAQTLIEGGYLPEGTTFTSPTTRFMIYRCGGRAAIFALSAVTVAAEDQTDWAGCTQNPVTRYNRPHYQVTGTVAEVLEAAAASGQTPFGAQFPAPEWNGQGLEIVGHRVTADWQAVDDPNIGRYRIQYGLGGPGTWSTPVDQTARVANFATTANRKQCVMVRAEAANGRLASEWSAPRCDALGDVGVDVSITGSDINVGQTNWSVVSVDLTNTNLAAVQIELTYNPDVVKPIGCTVDQCNPISPGIIRMAAYNQDIWDDDFQLGGVNFEAIGTGSSDLSVTVEAAGDEDGWEPPVTAQDGSLVVPAMLLPPAVLGFARMAQATAQDLPEILGDVNCDGELNIVDAYDIARFSVGLLTDSGGCEGRVAGEIHATNGDMTFDGQTIINDAFAVANCAVGNYSAGCPGLPYPAQPNIAYANTVFGYAYSVDSAASQSEVELTVDGLTTYTTIDALEVPIRTFAPPGPFSTACVAVRGIYTDALAKFGPWSARSCASADLALPDGRTTGNADIFGRDAPQEGAQAGQARQGIGPQIGDAPDYSGATVGDYFSHSSEYTYYYCPDSDARCRERLAYGVWLEWPYTDFGNAELDPGYTVDIWHAIGENVPFDDLRLVARVPGHEESFVLNGLEGGASPGLDHTVVLIARYYDGRHSQIPTIVQNPGFGDTNWSVSIGPAGSPPANETRTCGSVEMREGRPGCQLARSVGICQGVQVIGVGIDRCYIHDYNTIKVLNRAGASTDVKDWLVRSMRGALIKAALSGTVSTARSNTGDLADWGAVQICQDGPGNYCYAPLATYAGQPVHFSFDTGSNPFNNFGEAAFGAVRDPALGAEQRWAETQICTHLPPSEIGPKYGEWCPRVDLDIEFDASCATNGVGDLTISVPRDSDGAALVEYTLSGVDGFSETVLVEQGTEFTTEIRIPSFTLNPNTSYTLSATWVSGSELDVWSHQFFWGNCGQDDPTVLQECDGAAQGRLGTARSGAGDCVVTPAEAACQADVDVVELPQGSSKRLRSSLQADIALAGEDAHHIVQKGGVNEDWTAARLKLAECGIHIDSTYNGVFLPANCSTVNRFDKTVHSKLNNNYKYRDYVTGEVLSATNRNELLTVLEEIKELLTFGTRNFYLSPC